MCEWPQLIWTEQMELWSFLTRLGWPSPWRQVLKTGSIALRGLLQELHIGQVHAMLLLSLMVSVTVIDAGAVHVGVTGAVHVGLIVAMAMAMAIAVTPRASENISGQGASKRGNPLAQLRGRWFELVDAAPVPKGGGTVLLRYDCRNLCVRSFGEPSPESPIRGGGGCGK